MDRIKEDVCECLKLSQNRLHEIELDDIQLTPNVQKNIYDTIAQMFTPSDPLEPAVQQMMFPMSEVVCKGYWVENTKELILYLWLGDKSKAIIIPKNGWFIRNDIVFH